MHLQWDPISKHAHNGHLLGYTIYYHSSCYNHGGRENVSASTTSYPLSGLRTGAKYEIRIAAFTVVGIGPESHNEIFTCKNCSVHGSRDSMSDFIENDSAFTLGAWARCWSTELAQHLNVDTTFFKNSKPKFGHGVISQVQARNLVIEYLSGHHEPG